MRQRSGTFGSEQPSLGKMGAPTSPVELEFFLSPKRDDFSATFQRPIFAKRIGSDLRKFSA